MPKKQTRENIEAELSANEIDCGVSKLQEAVRGIMEFGARLREMEDDWGIPEFCRSKPIVERMAAVGMSTRAIEAAATMFTSLPNVGKRDVVPDHVRRNLAQTAEAEISEFDPLQDILDARRHH